MGNRAPDRAVVFIDGNNWYHYLKEAGIQNTFSLDYKKISEKLLGPRQWMVRATTSARSMFGKAQRFMPTLGNS